MLKFLSVCSGIEAASVAWTPLGWQAVAFAEIEPFPSAVLKHHYPDTPNWGDMTNFKDWPDATIDLLCGGTPCQSFSVAGLRKGLADPRGNLMLTFGAIAAKYSPRWLVWENVPGVLSINGGWDFGCFLGMLGQLGYGFAYRVLDAQYAGLAQRRKRVFVVGCLGDWRSAAAVLFERHSLSGNPAPSRKARQDVTPTIRAGATNGGAGHVARSGDSKDEFIVPVSPTLDQRSGRSGANSFATSGGLVPIAGTIETSIGRTRGAGISPGVLTPVLHAAISPALKARDSKGPSSDGDGDGAILVPMCFDTTQITSAANRSNPKPGNICHSIAGGAHPPAIAFPANLSATQHASAENLSPSLGAVNPTAVAVSLRGRDGGATAELGDEVGNALRASGGGGDKAYMLAQMAVRRLTPIECERLQGFPDDYTAIPWRNKPASECPDGPRYKAIGNSWAVPVARWIGERINAVEAIRQRRAA